MNFAYLDEVHQKWKDVLVIGRTIERENRKYHIIGMTAGEEMQLYILEPYQECETEQYKRKRVLNRRQLQKVSRAAEACFPDCSEIRLGDVKLEVQGGTATPMKYEARDYESSRLFFAMLDAGWTIPRWLKDESWEDLQLVALRIVHQKRLPDYSHEMSIVIKHRANAVEHIVEKTLTLTVGQSRSFCFTDACGDKVECHINRVMLMDVWKEMEEQFADPAYTKRFSSEQIAQVKKHLYETLEQSCPKGMCYIGIEYECSKDISLQFYSKEFLKSRPESGNGSASALWMRLKPDRERGTHNLPLRSCAIQTAVAPDTTKIAAELFSYLEKTEPWEEKI